MRIENDVKLDFDDVLIRPKRSEIGSRADIDLVRRYTTLNSRKEMVSVPILAANMDCTGTFSMAAALSKHKIFTCLHKFYSIEQLVKFFSMPGPSNHVFYSLGITDIDITKLLNVKRQVSIDRLCIDVANMYSTYATDRLKYIRDLFPEAVIIAGNVATPEMVQELLICGADIVKTGVGPGLACSTREVTGCGYPQLSCIIECADAAHGLSGHIVADGGTRTPGDVCKAFAAGADFVMIGGQFSGVDECEGEWIEQDGVKKLKFYGMSSTEAMNKYAGGVASYRASEGKCIYVEAKGPVDNVVQQILGGLRSCCSYVGTSCLKNLSKCTTFVRVNRTHR